MTDTTTPIDMKKLSMDEKIDLYFHDYQLSPLFVQVIITSILLKRAVNLLPCARRKCICTLGPAQPSPWSTSWNSSQMPPWRSVTATWSVVLNRVLLSHH